MYFQLSPSTHHTEETEFGLLPTPLAVAMEQTNFERYDARMERLKEKGHKPFTMPLDQMALRGMLPTPTAMDSTNATATMKSTQVKEGSMHSVTLTRALSMGILPTPNAQDWNTGTKPETYQARKERHATKGVNLQMSLRQMAMGSGILPTPMSSDCGEKVTGLENQDSLVKRAREITGKTSQLSPHFVMEMMGFPTDWTLLPFLNGEKNQSKQEGMQ
jgi:hypothetical protein